MRSSFLLVVLPILAACSSSNGSGNGSTPGTDAATAADTSTPATGDDAGAVVPDGGTSTEAGGGSCTAARANLLEPVDAVTKGAVTILSDTNGVKTIYVDASAGGTQGGATNPRVYISLETGLRVDLTDPAAETSTAWDLAIKRPVIYTNDGDGGPGKGGAAFLTGTDFGAVTSADATAATFAIESFFDADCNPNVDATGEPLTSFSTWYDYNDQQHTLAPHPGTWLVKGATGKIYKLAILNYYATPDGGTGTAGGEFVFKIAAL